MRLSSRSVALGGSLLLTARLAHAGYRLDITYDTTNFFKTFDFFTAPDPTQGFVEYVDGDTANKEGLAGYANGGIFMGVDYKTMNPVKGRKSVRVTSQKAFTHGLFIADIAHMPGSICGTWPAFWMFGPNWPTSGEIDIIEGVNTQTNNSVTLHTSSGCSISNEGTLASTKVASLNCASAGDAAGCGQRTADSQNYGDGFNAIGGGVYATEWTSDHIAVWFFPRSSIPRDIQAANPNPSSWGVPVARFVGGQSCNIDERFSNNQLVFDTTFCGTWAGDPAVWGSNPKCSALAPTCSQYVANNPADFAETFWVVNSIKVYQQGAGNGTQSSEPLPSATRVLTTLQTMPTGLTQTTKQPQSTTQQPQSTTQLQPASQPQPSTSVVPAAVAVAAPQPQPSQVNSNNAQIQAQVPRPAQPQASPKTDKSWSGQIWDGKSWSVRRRSKTRARAFMA